MEDNFPDSITDYFFYDEDGSPVLFSILPLEWNGRDDSQVAYLCGNVDNSESCFEVKSWKYDSLLQLWVLLTDGDKCQHWMRLLEPLHSYSEFTSSVMVSLHCLFFFRREPNGSWQNLVDYVSTVYSLCKPLEDYLLENINFLVEATKGDEMLKKSKTWNQIIMMKLSTINQNHNQHPTKLVQVQSYDQHQLHHVQHPTKLVQVQSFDQNQLVKLTTQLLYLETEYAKKTKLYRRSLNEHRSQQHKELREDLKEILKAVEAKEPSFRTQFSKSKDPVEKNRTLWISSGLFVFSVLMCHLLLRI